MLTKRQKQIFDFISKYSEKREISPSLEEIRKHFKLRSVSNIHQHVEAIRRRGYLQKQKNQQRGIEVRKSQKMVSIPLLGLIAAGQPIEAIENKETIAVPADKLPQSGECYALRVTGDSMVEEDINDGDTVIIRKQNTAQNGERIVALVDNYETTLKKFYRERDGFRLQPANKHMSPIIIGKGRALAIQGIVVDVVKPNTETMVNLSETKPRRQKKLPLNTIVLGDVIEELRKLPDESCDIIIIDPPYNIGKDFGNNIDKRELQDYVAWAKSWIYEATRILKPTGTMFIYGFSEILAHLSVEIPLKKRWLIWHYTNKNVASLHSWQRSHEAILCVWKDKPIFNRDEVREPYTEGFLNGAAGKVRKDTVGRFSKGGKETVYTAHEKGALPRDVIKVPALAGGAGMSERWFLCEDCDGVFRPEELKKHRDHAVMKHPTQKPLELTKRLIKSAQPIRDGVVLVPFMGSGSECVATQELGMHYIGIEINPDYVKLAKGWLQNVEPDSKLF